MDDQMQFTSALTTEHNVDAAIQALLAQVSAQLDGQTPDLVIAFLSPHFVHDVAYVTGHLQSALKPRVMLGCTAEGVIGCEQEVERQPAIVLVAACLPAVTIRPFTLQADYWRDLLEDPDALYAAVGAAPEAAAPEAAAPKLFILLGEPFSVPMPDVLQAFNTFYPDVPVIGGMASGARQAGGNVLFLNDQLLTTGAVGLAFEGALDVSVVVSQGCRPVGEPFVVTAAQRNVILSLANTSPLVQIQNLFARLSDEDKALMQSGGLLVGRAIDPEQEILGRGDFLVRSVTGVDPDSGAIAIGDYVKPGETVQFHLRDAATAEEDLEMMLAPQEFYAPPKGALLFSCNGRGTRLYDYPNGDISTVRAMLGDEVNLAGFFCAGEIGPIGGKNFLHGHTASMVLFRPAAES